MIFKAAAWRARDKMDIESLLALHGAAIDLDRVRDLVRQIAEALEEPQRVEEFEALLRRAGVS